MTQTNTFITVRSIIGEEELEVCLYVFGVFEIVH